MASSDTAGTKSHYVLYYVIHLWLLLLGIRNLYVFLGP